MKSISATPSVDQQRAQAPATALQLTIDVRKAFDTGIGTYIRQVVPRVARALPGARIDVVINPGQSGRHDYLTDCDVSFVEITAPPLSVAEQWQLGRLLRRDRLFWATSLAHPLLAGGAIVNTVFDLAQLALPPALGGSARQRLLARPFFHRIRRLSRQVLFISEFSATEFRRLVGEPAGANEVIALGVDADWFDAPTDAAAYPMAEPYFVMLGNLRPHKNLALALKAFAIVAPTLPHSLLLIGPGSAADLSEELRADLDRLAQRIVFAGQLPQAATRSALRRAEALLFPSFYEGFGLPVLEAMACGCPVLVARNGVSPELAGSDAPSFDPHDAAGLAEAMIAQAGLNDAERRRRREAGVTRAHQFSWDRTAERTAEALRRAGNRLRGKQIEAVTA